MVPKTPQLTDDADAPTANRVASALRSRILTGLYQPGQWLPTQRDLASELGVNRRAINAAVTQLAGEGLLSCQPGCRPVVLKAAARAGLRRIPMRETARVPAADPSRTASSRLVALLMWHGGFEQRATAQQRIFWGMNLTLAQAGYHAVFLDLGELGTPDENAAHEAAHLRNVLDQGFAGVVFYAYAYRSNRELVQQVAEHVPMVLIDRMLPGLPCDFVGVDNFHAMRDATRHLLSLGHRRIAYMTKLEPINTVYDRFSGYQDALEQAGLSALVLTTPPDSDWDLFDSQFRKPAGQRPTALLCVNDYEAVKAADRLAGLGLRVPEDVSLVGFDDIVQVLPTGAALTTVAQPFEEIGSAAARLVIDRQEGSAKPFAHIELPASLMVRASAAALSIHAEAGSEEYATAAS